VFVGDGDYREMLERELAAKSSVARWRSSGGSIARTCPSS
jgi:hypothetical protein